MKKNIALIIALTMLIFIFSGCGNNKKNNDLVNRAINKVVSAKSFSFAGNSESTVNNQAAESFKFTGFYLSPNETYTSEKATYLGNNFNIETCQKDNDFYTKKDTKWAKSDATEAASIKQSGAGGSPVDFLKDLKTNSQSVYSMPDKVISGHKYKVLKITSKTDKLEAKTKKAIQANLDELTKSELPGNKATVTEQKKQLQAFLKTLQIILSYYVYINPNNNELWRVDMIQIVNAVIDKDKNQNIQKFTLNFSALNQPVSMPNVGK